MDSGSSLSTSSSAAAAAAAAGPVSSSSSWSSSTTAAAMNASIPNGATSSSGTGAGLSFSLLCHNILAPVWCRPEWFTGIHSQLLDTEQRCRIICSNIQRWSPDIICLQEVETQTYERLQREFGGGLGTYLLTPLSANAPTAAIDRDGTDVPNGTAVLVSRELLRRCWSVPPAAGSTPPPLTTGIVPTATTATTAATYTSPTPATSAAAPAAAAAAAAERNRSPPASTTTATTTTTIPVAGTPAVSASATASSLSSTLSSSSSSSSSSGGPPKFLSLVRQNSLHVGSDDRFSDWLALDEPISVPMRPNASHRVYCREHVWNAEGSSGNIVMLQISPNVKLLIVNCHLAFGSDGRKQLQVVHQHIHRVLDRPSSPTVATAATTTTSTTTTGSAAPTTTTTIVGGDTKQLNKPIPTASAAAAASPVLTSAPSSSAVSPLTDITGVIICGDFNAEPAELVQQLQESQVSDVYSDAFQFDPALLTYYPASSGGPGSRQAKRIDYVLYRTPNAPLPLPRPSTPPPTTTATTATAAAAAAVAASSSSSSSSSSSDGKTQPTDALPPASVSAASAAATAPPTKQSVGKTFATPSTGPVLRVQRSVASLPGNRTPLPAVTTAGGLASPGTVAARANLWQYGSDHVPLLVNFEFALVARTSCSESS